MKDSLKEVWIVFYLAILFIAFKQYGGDMYAIVAVIGVMVFEMYIKQKKSPKKLGDKNE